jgi:hypothetical protein
MLVCKGKKKMSIHSGNQSPAATNATNVPPVQQAPAAQTGSSRWSFHSKGAFGKGPIGSVLGSEALTNLQVAMAEEYKNSDERMKVTLIPIDNANEKAHFSCLVVCLSSATNVKAGVAYHTLLVEASAPALTARNEVINQVNVEIFPTASDAYDADLINMIVDRVRAVYPNVPQFNASAAVIPRTFDIQNKSAVRALAANAGLACATELETRSEGFVDLDLSAFAGDSKLQVALSFSNEHHENPVGLPVRSDVSVNFISQQNKWTPNVSVNSGDRAEHIGNVTGFVDLVWSPVAQATNMYAGSYQQPMYGQSMMAPTQQYTARFVITSMRSDFAFTAPFQLLSLVTAMAVGADANWMQAFRPVHVSSVGKKRRVNMHDIGAIGYEVNSEVNTGGASKRIVTDSDTFRPEQLGQLLSAFVRPGMLMSMDIPEVGPESWYSGFISSASNNVREAYDALYHAAGKLTGGAFTKNFAYGSPMFDDVGNRVHMGFYTDDNGIKKDIRDIDYLAVANLSGESAPATIRDWSDTFVRTNYPLPLRLSARKKMIMHALPDAVFTGYANRVTFTANFLEALVLSCKQAGLDMFITTPMNSGDLNNARAVPSFINNTIVPMTTPVVFNQSGGSMQAGQSYANYDPRFQN